MFVLTCFHFRRANLKSLKGKMSDYDDIKEKVAVKIETFKCIIYSQGLNKENLHDSYFVLHLYFSTTNLYIRAVTRSKQSDSKTKRRDTETEH